MRALICGYGRAGKRHEKLLKQFGIEVDIFDPPLNLKPALDLLDYDFCVIASPPDMHLQQLYQCQQSGIPTLVEKPLCGFDEGLRDLLDFKKVSVAYNYRYHPTIKALKDTPLKPGNWSLFSNQHRPEIPSWGLLLDHLPHTLDILQFVTGELPVFKQVTQYESSFLTGILLTGTFQGGEIIIEDRVIKKPIEKFAYIQTPRTLVEVETNHSMFEEMYKDFLAGNYTGLRGSIDVQATLNHAKSLLEGRSVAV